MTKDVNVYEACDKAIKAMNRQLVEDFGKLRLTKWDEVNIIKTVIAVYRASVRKARKRYYDVAFDAYLIMMAMCEIPPDKARRMAEEAITRAWVDNVLEEVDPVTLYCFDTETDRKAYRLAESLEVTKDILYEIDKAMHLWSRQLGQYAINMTDYAMIQALQDAGYDECEWVTQRDEKVCGTCGSRDGKVYRLEDIPVKHPNCRCYVKPRKKVLNGNAV